jgi:hypothetical protein
VTAGRRWLAAGGALALYATVVVRLTWPLGAHLTTHLPHTAWACLVDPPYMGWVLSYESRTLLTDPTSLPNAPIYHPTPNALFYGDTGFGLLPYFMPTFLAWGNPTLALNLAFLGCLVLTSWALYLLVVRWTGSHLAGLLSGLVPLTTYWTLWDFVPCAPSYSVLQYVPLIMLVAARPAERWRDVFWLVPLVALQCLTDVVYVATAVMAPLGVLAALRLARRATRAAGLRLLAALALVPVVLLPIYVGHATVRWANPNLAEQTPWKLEPLTRDLPWGPFRQGATAIPLAAFILIALGAMSCMLPRRDRATSTLRIAWMHGALWAASGFGAWRLVRFLYWEAPRVLSGRLVPLFSPIYEALRTPERVAATSLLGLAVLVVVAFAECARRLPSDGRWRWLGKTGWVALAAVCAAGMYANVGAPPDPILHRPPLPKTYPLVPVITDDSPLLPLIRSRPGPLLELPVWTADYVVPHVNAMYRAIYHQRRLLNGYSSYWPAEFPRRVELARQLPDHDALDTLRRETGVATILLHLSDVQLSEQRVAWVLAVARPEQSDLVLLGHDGADMLFEVRPAKAEPSSTVEKQ